MIRTTHSHPPTVVSLVYREAMSSVFASQVLTPLEAVQGSVNVILGLLTPVGHLWRNRFRAQRDDINDRCREAGVPVSWIPSPPSRVPWLWSNVALLRQWFSRRFDRDQSFLVRCRNTEMTCMALDALHTFPRARVVYDCRGAEVCELIQCLGMEDIPRTAWSPQIVRRVSAAEERERRAVAESAGVIAVSHAMAAWLRQRYSNVSCQKYYVVPCCVDVERFRQASLERDAVRLELGVSDRFVVTYLGSLAAYQLPAASLRVFRLIQALHPRAHFLAITSEPDQMRTLAVQAGLTTDSLTIRSVTAREVPQLLVASDLGLLLRDRSETNLVASPVKYGEYLAACVPVITTPGLGDCSEHVLRFQLGVEVDLADGDAVLTARLREWLLHSLRENQHLRVRCQQFAESHLSWSGTMPRLIEWYSQLRDVSRADAASGPHTLPVV